ncbi:MFS transporter [Antricoccus suffuscus]|nr:MFS transporter [Antricoccus suffuscus]
MTDMSRDPEIVAEVATAAGGVPVIDTDPPTRPAPPSRSDLRLPRWLVIGAIILLAGNLRAAVNVIGAVLPQMREALDLSGAEAGLLTALPAFCFGFLGAAGPFVARKLGPSRTVIVALVVMTLGQLVRAFVPGRPALFTGSAITLAAIAIANVLMPSLVRYYFPRNVAALTAVYTVTLAAFSSAASILTLPFENAVGGDWRVGLGSWAAFSLVAILPWLIIGARDRAVDFSNNGGHLKLLQIAHSFKAWILALFFGVQAFQAYIIFGWMPTILHDEGHGLVAAAAYVGLVSLVSMGASIFVPTLMHRLHHPSLVVWALSAFYIGGYVGLYFQPLHLTWLWTSLIGIGSSYFTLTLFVVTMRARTHGGVLSLSGFMQGAGYVLAGAGLLLFGIVHGNSKVWDAAIIVLVVLTVFQTVIGLVSVSRWTIEDELQD